MCLCRSFAEASRSLVQSLPSPRGMSIAHCPETDPKAKRKLPECECLGPARLRKLLSVGFRVSFRVINGRALRGGATPIRTWTVRFAKFPTLPPALGSKSKGWCAQQPAVARSGLACTSAYATACTTACTPACNTACTTACTTTCTTACNAALRRGPKSKYYASNSRGPTLYTWLVAAQVECSLPAWPPHPPRWGRQGRAWCSAENKIRHRPNRYLPNGYLLFFLPALLGSVRIVQF